MGSRAPAQAPLPPEPAELTAALSKVQQGPAMRLVPPYALVEAPPNPASSAADKWKPTPSAPITPPPGFIRSLPQYQGAITKITTFPLAA